jgi:hypothetical protein
MDDIEFDRPNAPVSAPDFSIVYLISKRASPTAVPESTGNELGAPLSATAKLHGEMWLHGRGNRRFPDLQRPATRDARAYP